MRFALITVDGQPVAAPPTPSRVVPVVILAGLEWRDVRYMTETPFDLSDAYAKHVVEVLRVARYA